MKIASFSKTYEGRVVLDFPGMELQEGKIYAIIGANGSGKSTFGKILSGILRANKKGQLLSYHLPQLHLCQAHSLKPLVLPETSTVSLAQD